MGRWFLPKGNISRSTLSQLLLVYMSLASDIVDLLSLLNEVQVQESNIMHCFTLSIFSWSLFQFSLNLVVSRGRSYQSITTDSDDDLNNDCKQDDDCESNSDISANNKASITNTGNVRLKLKKKRKRFFAVNCLNFDSEIWSIIITLIFQDGPFLALRVTAVFRFGVRTFVTMFFTCKNAIILFIQMYRLFAICTEQKKNRDHKKDDELTNKANLISTLSSATNQLDKFIILTHMQNMLIMKNKPKSTDSNEKKQNVINSISPMILKSNLSQNYSYVIVLTPNHNLNVTCCKCDCHPK